MANLLHQLAPDGDVHAAALALRQVSLSSASMTSASMIWCQLESKNQGQNVALTQSASLLLSSRTCRTLLGKSRSNAAELCLYVYNLLPNSVQTQRYETVNLFAVLVGVANGFHAVSLSQAP